LKKLCAGGSFTAGLTNLSNNRRIERFAEASMRKVFIAAVLFTAAVPVFGQVQVAQPDVTQQQIPQQQVPPLLARPGAVSQQRSPIARPAPAFAEVQPNAPIITLDGVCEQPHVPAKKTTCKTTLTRAQFDAMVDTLAPQATDASRRQFAVAYARLLAASATADQQHLDKDPAVAKELDAKIKLVRMQVLSEALYRKFQEKADSVPSAEIEKYYSDHLSNFDQINLQRITFPESARTSSGTRLDPETVKNKAEEIQARAAAGEDFDALQLAAFSDLGIKVPVMPSTKIDKVRRGNLPETLTKAFDLKVGEVSGVLQSFDGFAVIKLVSKESIPLETVKPEIQSTLRQEHMQQELHAASAKIKADFNLNYVQSPTAPDLFPPAGALHAANLPGKMPDSRTRNTMARRRRPPVIPGVPGAPNAPMSVPAQ
jgi:hypothetical protein